MHAIAVALSAFSARAIRGRRAVLLAYTALIALGLLGLAHLIAARVAEDGGEVSTLAIADLLAMFALGGALFVVAPAMVAAQVAEERRAGTLDLLRTAPLTPTALTAGVLVGAPGSLYLLLLGPLGIHVTACALGVVPLSVLPQSLLILGLGAMMVMLGAVLLASAVGREGGGAAPLLVAGSLAVGAFVAVAMATGPDSMPWASCHPAGALAVLYETFPGPFLAAFSSPWRIEQLAEGRTAAMLALEPIWAIGVYAAAAVLLLVAARRALAADVVSRLTKLTALGLFALATIALVVPMWVVVPAEDLRRSSMGLLAFALVGPYLAGVLGATPSGTAGLRRSPRLSPEGSPFLIASLMLGSAAVALLAAYRDRPLSLIAERDQGAAVAGLVLLALSVPIYAVWAATRVATPAGRLAFWALVGVHLCLQVPAIFVVTEGHGRDVGRLLAQLDLVLGACVPLLLAWRLSRARRAGFSAV